jgi:hypothetical protein
MKLKYSSDEDDDQTNLLNQAVKKKPNKDIEQLKL